MNLARRLNKIEDSLGASTINAEALEGLDRSWMHRFSIDTTTWEIVPLDTPEEQRDNYRENCGFKKSEIRDRKRIMLEPDNEVESASANP